MLGKTEGRRRGRQRMRWLDGITDLMDMNLSKLWDIVDRGAWWTTVHRVTKNQISLSDFQFSSIQFSLSVVSNSLQPHGLQHARSPSLQVDSLPAEPQGKPLVISELPSGNSSIILENSSWFPLRWLPR